MKKLKKYSTLIVFALIVILDYHFDFLGKLFENDNLERLIMFLGCLGFAGTTKPNLTSSLFSKYEEDTGGGGVPNPPKNGNG